MNKLSMARIHREEVMDKAELDKPLAERLGRWDGMSGFAPVHPTGEDYMAAYKQAREARGRKPTLIEEIHQAAKETDSWPVWMQDNSLWHP